MDPRMFKLLGGTYMMPVTDPEDGVGGGDTDGGADDAGDEDGEGDGDEDDEDSDESESDDDGDEDESDGDEDEEGSDGSESEDDEADEEELGKLGQRAQKRIKGLVAKNKDLARQLEEARKLGGDDGEAILAAATRAGILPNLMTKQLADGLKSLADKKDALSFFEDQLDTDEDEFEIGGKTYSRRQLERRERTLKDEIQALESKYGKDRDKAMEDAKGLLELGLAAKKAGWKPGEGKKTTTKAKKRDEPSKKASHKQKTHRTEIDFGDVEDDDQLEAMIAAERRKRA